MPVIKSNMADEKLVLLRLVRDAILSIVRQLDGGNVSEYMTDYLAFRLDQLYGHILRLTASNPNLREVEPLICEAARSLRILVGMSSNDCYELPLEHSGHVGRPRFGVSRAQLEYLLQNDFTGEQISDIIRCFVSTRYIASPFPLAGVCKRFLPGRWLKTKQRHVLLEARLR